jgi:putative transposase
MPFPIRAVQVDGGSEFAAEFEQACQQRGLHLFVLPPRSPKLNGAVERANRTHTEEFYQVTACSLEMKKLNRELRQWERIYNTVRPHQDGCAGLAAAIPTVYPRVRHQRCWVHKMRNILEKVRKRDYDEVKAGAQAIYLAESRAHAESAFRRFRARWLREYGPMVRRLQRDLPELLSVFAFPRHLWQKLRTTNVIERCFVEVRRRTRPMVCFVNVESVDRIIYSIFQRFNLEWKTRTLNLFTQAA